MDFVEETVDVCGGEVETRCRLVYEVLYVEAVALFFGELLIATVELFVLAACLVFAGAVFGVVEH